MVSEYPTGRTVPFPYESLYPQQISLMDALLCALHDDKKGNDSNIDTTTVSKVMLLESPTGTGKSLSLACSAMAWLRYQQQLDLKNSITTASSTAETTTTNDWLDDWVAPEERERLRQEKVVRERAQSSREALEQELQAIRARVGQQEKLNRERRENLARNAVTAAKMTERQQQQQHKKKKSKKRRKVALRPDEDHCVADYRSDQEDEKDSYDSDLETNASIYHDSGGNILDGAALDGSSAVYGHRSLGNVRPSSGVRKIVYAARTHSQLSQFVGELGRTAFAKDVRVVALGGRKVLCGNADVNRPGRSEQAVNDACLDLQKDKQSSCPLVASKEGLATLALHTLAQPSDIEDTAALGKASHCCAYYSSRMSLPAAEVVVLPYSMLLSQSARQAVGLSLKQSFVIVDEAHNLPEAIRSLHSCRMALPVVKAALDQLVAYTKRYTDRLAGPNLYYLGQIRRCLKAFITHLQQMPQPQAKMMSAGELLIELKLDHVNLFKILSYLDHSRLPQKLLGFTNAITSIDPEETELSKHISSLSIVQTFLSKLTCTSKEGKVVTDWPKAESARGAASCRHPTLRFVALHPAAHFENVLREEPHAVALVGGTLRPFSHVAAELLDPKLLSDAIKADSAAAAHGVEAFTTFSSPSLTAFTCDHVVPASNVLLECLSFGPSGTVKLDFRHSTRGNHSIMDELGETMVQLTATVPAGIVVFLPSYSYEAQLVHRWQESGIWSRMNRHKRVYREPKQSALVETTLNAYSKDAAADSTSARGGSLLLSVVGGKMSEGINFADDMARCVVVVGLPYPDITDPELKEKMSTMDNQTGGGITGQTYYQNLCMRAVNQSVGRAIRHANDYAAIILADARYATDARIWDALPTWLKRRGRAATTTMPQHCCSVTKSFHSSIERLDDFFVSKRDAAASVSP